MVDKEPPPVSDYLYLIFRKSLACTRDVFSDFWSGLQELIHFKGLIIHDISSTSELELLSTGAGISEKDCLPRILMILWGLKAMAPSVWMS